MLLPSVIKKVYASRAEILSDVLEPIIPGLNGNADEAEKAAIAVERWLFGLGITSKLSDEGFTEEDINVLTTQVFETASLAGLLKLAPISADENTVKEIYKESLVPLNAAHTR
jgi:alcohol dehydrogenase class IV